ncbi:MULTISPECIES: alkyl hydroperoxide reductase [Elizabethkingia]|uniref:Alkyl hydroperoxide reductase n=1 Tax=Elizabethkingia ursingii TaxID=1756150 RepID=A0AAJ3TQ13_9FLAO|nr:MULTISPECIES: alkyl hydroperoxide reductase [Elizabethkingia]AQW92911.1 alkyl hydroperoxide reductase [Elizabethkingia anophelis]AQX09799.1 alkyl hydroperoxide reductase [Elizabethkingia ursingii]OPB60830.1 alkyl hydroperoxide reductase [Elizabethkingia anophelis]OPB78948.1 alkyl hydroperoxide reductase [Elizabethkingia ursingii]OPB91620.1 alkyl hydroperoxide reductase [Elizabethkingia ursingii]
MKITFSFILFLVLLLKLEAQEINMYFPKFSGKSYDFVIFQGGRQVTAIQGVVPATGSFTLKVPKEYAPYTGMSRWLITGTQEGGGLDMFIPGRNYAVSCLEALPNEKNIIYRNNNANQELNDLYKTQEKILYRYNVMQQALKAYNHEDKNYSVFQEEYIDQKRAYEDYQQNLQKKGDYISQFIQIVNITQGIGIKLYDNEKDKANAIGDYIVDELDWPTLYTSGHWNGVLGSWVSIHTRVLQDKSAFAKDFTKIGSKITNKDQYQDFVNTIVRPLREEVNKDYLEILLPIIYASAKYPGFVSIVEAPMDTKS